MKIIRGHKSFDQGEITEILKRQGNYTCPTLPHYRYDRVIETCRKFKRLGLLKRSGRDDISENLVVTDLFREWQDSGSPLGPEKWAKQKAKEQAI
jgi:hypothetical protein